MKDKYTNSMEYEWNNPPAPFNPDYNHDYVKRCKQYQKELMDFQNTIPDSVPDVEFDKMVNEKAKELKLKHQVYLPVKG